VDIASVYTLTPPAGSPIIFNSGVLHDGTDIYFLTDIKGLDSADLRVPQFLKPRDDGGYKPASWHEEPLHPRFQGAFVIQTKPPGADCREERNAMYHALKTCLRACRGTSPGELSWNEPGIGDFELEVFYEVRLDHGFDAGYFVMTFTFGLFSEASQPSGV